MSFIEQSLEVFLDNLNYGTITLLMAIESSFIPFPSEIVVAPAAYHAASGNLDIILVILFATLGADIGATVNYILAYYLGRPIVYRFANSRWGKLCLINQEKVEKSEKYFDEHGAQATFTGRLLPGIRQLISIPAGLAKMHFLKFITYTTLGAGIWNCILAAMGWYLHGFVPENELKAKVQEYAHDINVAIVIIAVLVIGVFLIWHFVKKSKTAKQK